MIAENHARRRTLLRAALAHAEVDSLLVTDLINVRYLTGFTGSNAALLVVASDDETGPQDEKSASDPARTRFCTDGRYTTQSAAEVPDLPRLIARPCSEALMAIAPSGIVGFEARLGECGRPPGPAESRRRQSPRRPAQHTLDLVEQIRAVKDAEEIDAFARACAVADQALAELVEAGGIRPGRTEREVGLDLDQRMRQLGAQDPSFETIVAAGPNSAIPHHRPTAASCQPGTS